MQLERIYVHWTSSDLSKPKAKEVTQYKQGRFLRINIRLIGIFNILQTLQTLILNHHAID